jgi:hypothetical protein
MNVRRGPSIPPGTVVEVVEWPPDGAAVEQAERAVSARTNVPTSDIAHVVRVVLDALEDQ